MELLYTKNGKEREVCLYYNNNNIGHFTVDEHNMYSMSIGIDDEYQGKGYSKIMILTMLNKMKEELPNIHSDIMFFIDADASAGYWDHIGMTTNRYGYDYYGKRKLEGCGYEKVITFAKLYKFANS